MGFSLQPIVIVLLMIVAIALIGTIACLVFARRVRGGIKRSILIVAAIILLSPSGLALICFKPELVDGRYRTYKQLYRDIQVGMSRAEVMALVEQHYLESGQRLRPSVVTNSEGRLSFNMNLEGSREPNSEGISVNLQQDLVVHKFYSKD